MDIHSRGEYPASALSNFASHRFVFDGIECASMEGLLQSFKFKDVASQILVCRLSGKEAKFKGEERKSAWKLDQWLYWRSESFQRQSRAYQNLLDRAYCALFSNPNFRSALLASGDEVLTHSIGGRNPAETILTEFEFCSRLMWLRSLLGSSA